MSFIVENIKWIIWVFILVLFASFEMQIWHGDKGRRPVKTGGMLLEKKKIELATISKDRDTNVKNYDYQFSSKHMIY